MDYQTLGLVAGNLTLVGWGAFQAHKANKQTKATGNGFARHVKDDLAEIKQGLGRVEGKIDRHIEDHAEADLRRRK